MTVSGSKKKRSFCLLLAVLAAVALIYAVRPAHALSSAEIGELQRKAQSFSRQGEEFAHADPSRAADMFQKAALCFEAIVREGGLENGKLFYNIGNCYLRMGDPGRAILNYRRAGRMIPGDPNLEENLDFARRRVRDALPPDRGGDGGPSRNLLLWLYDLGLLGRAWIFTGLWVLIWTCGSAYLFFKKAWLRYVFFSAAAAALLFSASLAFEVYLDSGPKSGVIVSGTEFKLLEERSGWLHVMLPGKVACWVPGSSAEII